MIELLFSMYALLEFFILIFWALTLCFEHNEVDGLYNFFKNTFAPQLSLMESCYGKINRAGKIILLVLTAIFFVPVNVLFVLIQIGVFLFRIVCKVFLYFFGVDEEG